MRQRLGLVLGMVAVMISIGGCSTPRPIQGVPGMSTEPPSTVSLAPGDVVDIKFFSVAELNEEQAIRPDGKISLQLIGEVAAAGRTPAQLREDLIRMYTPHLKTADVTVIVRSFQSRRVYVGGEVWRPGVINMPGQLTALEAVMEAGGFTRYAKLENVVIIRHKEGQRFGASLDYASAAKTGEMPPPFYLEPLDIVYVPETTITKVNRWIDQHINQLVPMFGIIYSFPAGEATVTLDTTNFRTVR